MEGWLIGMHCILYGFCILTLWPRRQSISPRVLMGVTTVMIVLAIGHAALSLRGLLEAFVWRPGGPDGEAYYANFAATPYKLKNVIYVINTFLADALLLWRVWVVWGYNWKIALVPAVLLLGSTVSEIFTTLALWELAPNESLFTTDVRRWFTAFWALSLATNVSCTTLIVLRILRSSADVRTYRAVLLVVIESGALYTLSIILCMTMYELNANAGQIANDVQTQLSVIGPTLIVVVVGRRMSASPSVKLTYSAGTNSYALSPITKPQDVGVTVEISRYVDVESRRKPSLKIQTDVDSVSFPPRAASLLV